MLLFSPVLHCNTYVCYYYVTVICYNAIHMYERGKSNCSECYQQFKEQENLSKHFDSSIKGGLGDGKDSCHVTLVNEDGE